MEYVLNILANVAVLLLSGIQLAMLLRAILSWFPMEPNKFTDFLFGITEPVIYPVRRLFERMHWFEGLPIDLSFTATWLLLIVVQVLLETFI